MKPSLLKYLTCTFLTTRPVFMTAHDIRMVDLSLSEWPKRYTHGTYLLLVNYEFLAS